MKRLIGYARVSTADQNLDLQKAALQKAGCHIILDEKMSGTKRTGRENLDLALKILVQGDSLVVTRLDRLGRSLRDLANIIHEIEERGASLVVTEQAVDTSTSAGRAFFGMLATFAAFETDVRRERQLEGIAKIKADPVLRKLKYKGGRKPMDRSKVLELNAQHRGPSYIARQLGINRVTVYRILKEAKDLAEKRSALGLDCQMPTLGHNRKEARHISLAEARARLRQVKSRKRAA